MVLASIGAAGSAIISTYGDPDNGEYKTEGSPIFCVFILYRTITLLVTFTIVRCFCYGIFRGVDFLAIPLE